MKFALTFVFPVFLVACSTGLPIQNYNDRPVNPDAFTLCHGYSCTSKTDTAFSPAEWQTVLNILQQNPAKTAEEERSKIGKAIAQMERFAGAKTGTDIDDKEAVGIKTSNYQMDCIDETINTTHYLTMLQKSGALKFYEAAEPTHRGYILDGAWPHNTAVVREKESGALFVVDSFYKANGEEPYIMPRQTWLNGWKPKGSKQ